SLYGRFRHLFVLRPGRLAFHPARSQSPTPPSPRPSFPTRRSSDLTSGCGTAAAIRRARSAQTTRYGAYASPVRNTCHGGPVRTRSEEHTSELHSHLNLVCRLLLDKKKSQTNSTTN